jgi:hypothetical protein
MILGKVPGVNLLFPFYEYYTEENPLDIRELYDNPQREKFGYLWKDLHPSFIKQTLGYKNSRQTFTGFYITSYEDAGICLSLFNRYLYFVATNKFEWLLKNFSDGGVYYNNIIRNGYDVDEVIWTGFSEFYKSIFTDCYVPFKKFLASKRPDKCWVSFSNHPLSPKNRPYSDFLCGLPSIEVFVIKSTDYFSPKHWEDAIKEGPLEYPEIPIFQDFFNYFPGTTKYAPNNIVEKIDVGDYREWKDFGII